jgi:hypothetical protein
VTSAALNRAARSLWGQTVGEEFFDRLDIRTPEGEDAIPYRSLATLRGHVVRGSRRNSRSNSQGERADMGSVQKKVYKSQKEGSTKETAAWVGRYLAPDGKERSKRFAKRADAEKWVKANEGDVVRGAWVDPKAGEVTLRDYANNWLDQRPDLRTTTAKKYPRSPGPPHPAAARQHHPRQAVPVPVSGPELEGRTCRSPPLHRRWRIPTTGHHL